MLSWLWWLEKESSEWELRCESRPNRSKERSPRCPSIESSESEPKITANSLFFSKINTSSEGCQKRTKQTMPGNHAADRSSENGHWGFELFNSEC